MVFKAKHIKTHHVCSIIIIINDNNLDIALSASDNDCKLYWPPVGVRLTICRWKRPHAPRHTQQWDGLGRSCNPNTFFLIWNRKKKKIQQQPRGSDSEILLSEKQHYLKRTLMPNLYKDVTDSWEVTSALSAKVKNTHYNIPPGSSHNTQASFGVLSQQEHLHLRINCGRSGCCLTNAYLPQVQRLTVVVTGLRRLRRAGGCGASAVQHQDELGQSAWAQTQMETQDWINPRRKNIGLLWWVFFI